MIARAETLDFDEIYTETLKYKIGNSFYNEAELKRGMALYNAVIKQDREELEELVEIISINDVVEKRK